jgi:hypothetical protein
MADSGLDYVMCVSFSFENAWDGLQAAQQCRIGVDANWHTNDPYALFRKPH